MTSYRLAIILTILTFTSAFGQADKPSCDCSKTQFAGTKADTSFQLSNGKTIVLCGYKNPKSNPTDFSEFILSVCGQDTIIDFWGAVLTCRLEVNNDTLLVQQIKHLPIGKELKYQPVIWSIEKIYFIGEKTFRKLVFNKQIPKYTQGEISSVLNTFETAKYGLDENKIELVNKLFIAAISGNNTARQYFKEFKTKFGTLDGAFAEEYSDLVAMLKQWDKY